MHKLGIEELISKTILLSDQALGTNPEATGDLWDETYSCEERFTSEFENFINRNNDSINLFLRCSEIQMPSYTALPIRYNLPNRLQHMVSTARLTKEALEKINFGRELKQKEKEVLILYANFHDIGHIGHELE